jgi:hypothetical protein
MKFRIKHYTVAEENIKMDVQVYNGDESCMEGVCHNVGLSSYFSPNGLGVTK